MERFIENGKKGGLLLLLMFAASLSYAQTLPLVEEGKTWSYYKDLTGMSAGKDGFFYGETIKGDTIVDGRSCKKLYSWTEWPEYTQTLSGVMYEEDGKVFHRGITSTDWPHVYDFNLSAGERIVIEEDILEVLVTEVHEEVICGVQRRVLTLVREDNDMLKWQWIEGIGSVTGMLTPFYHSGGSELYSCTIGDRLLYGKFPTGIHHIAHPTHSSTLYDLQGRRLTSEPQHGVFIKDRRKIVK